MPLTFYVFSNATLARGAAAGSEQRIRHWCDLWRRWGHELVAVCPPLAIDNFRAFYPEIRWHRIPSLDHRRAGTALTYLQRTVSALARLPRLAEPARTVIYTASDMLPDTLPGAILKRRYPAARWISGLHLVVPKPWEGYRGVWAPAQRGFSGVGPTLSFVSQRFCLRLMRRYGCRCLVSNGTDAERVRRLGMPADRITVTYGAVDTVPVDPADAARVSHDACFMGRFHPMKGVDDLLAAWALVVKARPTARLTLLGRLDKARGLVAKLGLERNVEFAGFVDGMARFAALRQCRLCVFPSYYESFGMVALEAMAAGLPVVAYDLPLYREVYPRGMVRAPVGDVDALAACVVRLLENEAERRQLARDARELAGEYTWERTARLVLDQLEA